MVRIVASGKQAHWWETNPLVGVWFRIFLLFELTVSYFCIFRLVWYCFFNAYAFARYLFKNVNTSYMFFDRVIISYRSIKGLYFTSKPMKFNFRTFSLTVFNWLINCYRDLSIFLIFFNLHKNFYVCRLSFF